MFGTWLWWGAAAHAAPCGPGEDPFGAEALRADVEHLASDALAGRAPGTPGDQATLAWIEERFRCLGLTPSNAGDSYRQPFATSRGDLTANVVAHLPGADPAVASEIVIVGGHHDHLGVRRGRVFNGANDNASGVAAVLAVARAWVEAGVSPRRTVAFVTFGHEERFGVREGSAFFVAHPPDRLPLERVAYMVNVDMVGTYPSTRRLAIYGSFPGTPGADLLPETGLELVLGKPAERSSSDFQPFCDSGVPYLYFATRDRDCYHRPCDDPERIDYPSLSTIARLVSDTALGLANSDRDLASPNGASRCELRGRAAR